MTENELLDNLNFSLEPKSVKLSIGDKQYIVKEASEDAYNAYKNVSMRALSFQRSANDADAMKGEMKGGAEADTVLVSRCLFEVVGLAPIEGASTQSPMERLVPYDQVKAFPRRITSRLYNIVRHLSGMDEEQETAEFLEKRIKSDTAKLEIMKAKGTPGKDVRSST